MTKNGKKAISVSSLEEDFPLHFSEWLKCRRRELDLTQEQLAQRASCSVFAIRKIESGERRPSRQLARTLSQALEIPAEDQPTFIQVARGARNVECLHTIIPGRSSLPAGEPNPTAGYIPHMLTPFIGREPELSALGELLCDPQCLLLTIVGPGGIGKTRLAIEAANQYKERFPDGVWFVSLAPLNSTNLIVPTIADALDFKFSDPTNPQAQLLRYLHLKKALLVLDNAEHLLDGVGIFTEILKHCPQVKMLVTSRERLNLLSEWVFDVQGLPVPASDKEEQFESYSSMALFLQSARQAFTGFAFNEADLAAIARICRLVGGMPLAIELAAAWVRTLSPAEIAQEIEGSLDVLSASLSDLPERHRSMRVVFDHSWKRLSAKEKQVLSRLSVFRGGFSRHAAELVAGASLPVLSTLVNRTLLRRTAPGRYELHELTRQYAYDQLVKAGEEKGVHDQALRYYLRFAELRLPEIQGKEILVLQRCLEEEMGNLRATLEWALSSGQIEEGMRLAWALFDLWYWHNTHAGEVRHWLETLLAEAERTPDLPVSLIGNLLYATGVIAYMQLDLLPAEVFLNRSLERYRSIGNQHGQAAVLNSLGVIAIYHQDFHQAKCLFDVSLDINRELGGNSARQLNNLGMVAYYQGNHKEALEYFQESLQVARESHLRGLVAVSLGSLGEVVLQLGDRQKARMHFLESLQIQQEVGDKEIIAFNLESLAGCYVEDDPSLAARLLGAADALRKLIGIPVPPIEAKNSQHSTELARTALGEAAFRIAWQEGEAKPLETLIQEILQRGNA